MVQIKSPQPLYVLVRSRSTFDWVISCLNSVLSQDFHDFTILFVDDASDYTHDQIEAIRTLLHGHIAVFNKERKYSLRNAYDMLGTYVSDSEAIIVNVDGDDYLSRRDALSIIAKTYKITSCWLTYGECRLQGHSWWGDRLPSRRVLPLHNVRYPLEVERLNLYRQDDVFRPLHPRTWKKWLFDKINASDFKDNDGKWFQTCEDQAMFFPMLEMSGGNYQTIRSNLYRYRIHHLLSDDAIHLMSQLKESAVIRGRQPYSHLKS